MKYLSLLLIVCGISLCSSCKKDGSCVKEKTNASRNANAPFHGMFRTSAEVIQPAPSYMEALTGNGHASTLGRSLYVAVLDIDMSGSSPYPVTGGATFQAKNGGEFNTQFTGTSAANNDGTFTVVLNHTVTDGFGKFQNVSGSLISTSRVNPSNAENIVSFSGVLGF